MVAAGSILAIPADPTGLRGRNLGFWPGLTGGRFATLIAQMDQLSPVRQRPAVSAPVIPPAADRMKRVIVAGLLVTLALVALQAASQAIDFSVFDLRIRALNSDKHDSVFGLASVLAQMAVAAASVWRGSRVERHRWAWFALGALAAGLALIRVLTQFNAAALAVPLVCMFGLLCWLTWRDPGAARAVVWAGLILMVTSLLLHKVGLAADSSTASDYTWAYQITGMVKHGAELAGWMLVATGIAAGIEGPVPEVTAAGVGAPTEGLRRPVTAASARALVRRARP